MKELNNMNMRAKENIHRLMAAALAMDFEVDTHTSTEEIILHRQTGRGVLTLTMEAGEHHHAQLMWLPDIQNGDFSIVPFDLNEDNDELVSVDRFEAAVGDTLKIHHDKFIGN